MIGYTIPSVDLTIEHMNALIFDDESNSDHSKNNGSNSFSAALPLKKPSQQTAAIGGLNSSFNNPSTYAYTGKLNPYGQTSNGNAAKLDPLKLKTIKPSPIANGAPKILLNSSQLRGSVEEPF